MEVTKKHGGSVIKNINIFLKLHIELTVQDVPIAQIQKY